jgi:cytochrome c6
MSRLFIVGWRSLLNCLSVNCLSIGLSSLIFWLGISSPSLSGGLPGDLLGNLPDVLLVETEPVETLAADPAEALVTDLPLAESAETAALFELHCAGCHAQGGNIVRRGKTLKQKALVRNGYSQTAAISQLITEGKGAMPAYADRLSAGEIEAIAQYVLQQAESGW